MDAALPAGSEILIEGDEAAHAALVKRLHPNDPVQLLDGVGGVADATLLSIEGNGHGKKRAGREAGLRLRVGTSRRVPPIAPRVELCTATPKGGRVDEMIDQLSQIGAASWRPLATSRGIVDPREHKLERMTRIAREACKQCGRAWMLEIASAISLHEALTPGEDMTLLVADASGEPLPNTTGTRAVRLLVGPEGGWTPEELELARARGARVVRFGPHVMRVETAAVAGASVLLSASR